MLPQRKPYLIGETAFHHEGDTNFLEKLIEEGLNAGVDTLKFHLLFDIDDYVVKDHKAREKLKKIQIPKHFWVQLHNKLVNRSINPIYLCNDVASLKWVNSLDHSTVEAIEIHATGINDIFLLEEAIKFNGTIILGTGGSSIDDLYNAIEFLRAHGKSDIFLMHGFQNYPTDYKDIRFLKMNILKQIFDLPVGYADHTDPNDDLNEYISCLPQASGYNVLEKHFTHVAGEERMDSQAAVGIDQLKYISNLMGILWQTSGTENPLQMSDAELKYGDVGPMKKAIVARNDISKGQLINKNDIAYKRTNKSTPIDQQELENFIGSKAKDNIPKDSFLTYNNIEYRFRKSEVSQFKLDKEKK